MGLTRLAVTRPLAILMLILGLVVMGLVSRSLLKVDRLPNIQFPFVSVSIPYSGASPSDVESLVLQPIEGTVAGVQGVTSMTATATEGRGNFAIQLSEDANADTAAVDIERRVNSIRSRLPADVGQISVNKADPSAFPIMNVALTGKRTQAELYDLAANVVQPKLLSILGVADVQVSGGLTQEVQIKLNYAKLEAYGLTVQDVSNALRHRGRARREALIEAGPIRLRPIVMTTCTIMFAMLPLVLKFEAGAESRAPMAAVVMGGVLSSMLLTLVVVPVMYTYFDDLGEFFIGSLRHGRKSQEEMMVQSPLPAIAGGSRDE